MPHSHAHITHTKHATAIQVVVRGHHMAHDGLYRINFQCNFQTTEFIRFLRGCIHSGYMSSDFYPYRKQSARPIAYPTKRAAVPSPTHCPSFCRCSPTTQPLPSRYQITRTRTYTTKMAAALDRSHCPAKLAYSISQHCCGRLFTIITS